MPVFKKIAPFLFLPVTLLVLWMLDWWFQFTCPPNGIHYIRQTDSLSFLLNYFYYDISFWTPENFNLMSPDGKAASEFPLLYYIGAFIAKTGLSPSLILRMLHSSIFLIGCQLFFLRIYRITSHFIISCCSALLTVGSTIVIYYSNNLLPDIAALGFTLIALFFYLKTEKSNSDLIWAFAFFSLASLIKITYAVYPIAAIGAQIFSAQKNTEKVKRIGLISASLVLVGSWWTYVHFYNESVGNSYFFNRSIPIWNTNNSDIQHTTELILHYWRNSYYPETTQWILLILFIAFLLRIKKVNRESMLFLLFSLIGIIAYVLLFFLKFADHDYYFMVFVPLVGLLMSFGTTQLSKSKTTTWLNITISLIAIGLTINAYWYIGTKIPKRWTSQDNLALTNNQLSAFKASLDLSDPDHKETLIILGDSTVSGTLYYLERKGYALPVYPQSSAEILSREMLNQSKWIIAIKHYQGIISTDLNKPLPQFIQNHD